MKQEDCLQTQKIISLVQKTAYLNHSASMTIVTSSFRTFLLKCRCTCLFNQLTHSNFFVMNVPPKELV
jgi:hypothetical protein